MVTLSNVLRRNTTRMTGHTYMKTVHINIHNTCIYCCLCNKVMQLYNNWWLCNLKCALTPHWSGPYYERSWSRVSEMHSRFLLKKQLRILCIWLWTWIVSDSSLSEIFQCHLCHYTTILPDLFWSVAAKHRGPMKALSQFGVSLASNSQPKFG